MSSRLFSSFWIVLGLSLSSCTIHGRAQEFNTLPGANNKPVEYLSTTKVGLNLLFVLPLFGDTSTEATVASLTEEALRGGAKNVDIVQSSSSVYWYIFPPISFFIHPVTSDISALVELPDPLGFGKGIPDPESHEG